MCVMCVVMVRGVAVLLGAALVVVRLVCGGYRVALLGVLLLRTGAFLVVRTGSGRARVRLAGLAVVVVGGAVQPVLQQVLLVCVVLGIVRGCRCRDSGCDWFGIFARRSAKSSQEILSEKGGNIERRTNKITWQQERYCAE